MAGNVETRRKPDHEDDDCEKHEDPKQCPIFVVVKVYLKKKSKKQKFYCSEKKDRYELVAVKCEEVKCKPKKHHECDDDDDRRYTTIEVIGGTSSGFRED